MPDLTSSTYMPNRLLERGDLLLALSLSAPFRRAAEHRSVTIEFTPEEIQVRTPYPSLRSKHSVKMLCSKETIAFAILLHDYWSNNGGSEAESSITKALQDSASIQAHADASKSQQIFFFANEQRNPIQRSLATLRNSLDLSDDFLKKCDSHCHSVFRALEGENLAIDPGFSPEYIALCGLIPMQFSVRTEHGEQLHRLIRLNAPLWNLNIDRVRRRGRNEYNWDFTIRGVNFVKGALLKIAEQYLASEASQRRSEDLPTLQPPTNIQFDGDVEE